MKPGQILFEVVSVENSAKEKISDCQMKTVVLTLDAGDDDLTVRQQKGVIGLRRYRMQRIATEAFQQGGLLTVEDIANRLLNCGERTVTRDIRVFKMEGICLPLRSTVKDMGRAISHREMIVKRWLLGMEFSEISRQTNHSIEAIANYVDKFKRVICLAKDNHEISTVAFLVKISVGLAQQYYDLYQNLKIVPCREKEMDDIIKKTPV
jgi:hypothetical protein